MKFTETKWFKEIIISTSTKVARNFQTIFELLENKKVEDFYIVETGCVRWDKNWEGDGQFTIIADKFINYYNGKVLSVNNNIIDIENGKLYVSNKTKIYHNDSVIFLQNLPDIDNVDLFYLDSFDLNFETPHLSSEHHYKEFISIIKKRSKGNFFICIDDCNIIYNNKIIGKGDYIQKLLKNYKIKPLLNSYQCMYFISNEDLILIKNNIKLISDHVF